MNWTPIFDSLKQRGVLFASGLTDSEIAAIQQQFGFQFPPDLREFLQYSLPISNSFLNWRSDKPEDILKRINWPTEGICFDITNNIFWLKQWGSRPEKLDEALDIARRQVRKAPKLIPIFSHRYIPETPCIAGNPVFSVHQSDIIHYGYDLPSYLANEFKITNPTNPPDAPRPIEFWDLIVNLD